MYAVFNVFCNFCVYLLDEAVENGDINEIFKSEQVQNALNTLEFKASK